MSVDTGAEKEGRGSGGRFAWPVGVGHIFIRAGYWGDGESDGAAPGVGPADDVGEGALAGPFGGCPAVVAGVGWDEMLLLHATIGHKRRGRGGKPRWFQGGGAATPEPGRHPRRTPERGG